MSMGDIVPTVPLGGNGYGFGGGDALAAFAGGAFGAWLGNGMMGGGFGYGNGWNRGGCCGGGYGGYGGNPSIVVVGENGGSHRDGCSYAEMQILEGQNAANLAIAQGFAGTVNASNQGFSGLQNTVNQGFSGVYNAITTGNAATQQSLCQGFNGLNAAILGASKDIALQDCQSTGAITRAIEQCCCNTQKAIAEQGQLTRDLINQNTITGLQTALCDAKSKIGSLESQAFVAASQTAQTAQFQHAIDRQSLQFGAILGAYRTGRIDERDSTATPAAGA